MRKTLGMELKHIDLTPPASLFDGVDQTKWKVDTAQPPLHYLAIGAIFKDEAPYLREWIEFHLLQGVEKFFLYDNNSTDEYLTNIMPYIQQGIVELKHWKQNPARQLDAYHSCIQTFGAYARWMAFIDIDEYLFPVEDEPLVDVLKRYEEYPGIAVHWKTFGTSGHVLKPSGLTIETYTRAPEYISNTVKLIIDPRKITRFTTAHSAAYKDGQSSVTEDFRPIDTYNNYTRPSSVLRINHYWTRSVEEFNSKDRKGDMRPNTGTYSVNTLIYREYHCTSDDTLIQRYLPALKARLQARSAGE